MKTKVKSNKARVLIEYRGKIYTVGKSFACSSKRNCALFERGVCDCDDYSLPRVTFPCEEINKAFRAIGASSPTRCYKEVKR